MGDGIASLRGAFVELYDEGQSICFRTPELTLHPNAVHLELPLAVHDQPAIDTELANCEQRVGRPKCVGVPQGRVDRARGWIVRTRERAAGGYERGIEAGRSRWRWHTRQAVVFGCGFTIAFTVTVFLVNVGRLGYGRFLCGEVHSWWRR